MRVRRLVIASLVATGALVPVVSTFAVTGPAAAKPASAPVKPAPAKPVKVVPVKPAKPVPFAAAGTVSSVDVAARTVTVAVKGGEASLRGRTVTLAVAPAARITVGDAPATLADLRPGHHVNVHGEQAGTVYTVHKANAVTPAPTA